MVDAALCILYVTLEGAIKSTKKIKKGHQPIHSPKSPVDGSKPRHEMPKRLFLYLISCQNAIKEVISIQHYETTDIFLGAYLLSSGGDLSSISFNDRQIATFMFTGDGLYQLDEQYQSGTALVNPVHLRASLNHLRDILFEMRDRRKRDEKQRRNRTYQGRH